MLEEIKDDLLLLHPSMGAEDKKAKVAVLRKIFQTSSWTALENDDKRFTVAVLKNGREALDKIAKEAKDMAVKE